MTEIKYKFETLAYTLYSAEEIRKLAVKELTSSLSIEPTLGRGALNGLYDPDLGSISEREPCRACNLSFLECNGHFGRIELPVPIYNPTLFSQLTKFIKGICFKCHVIYDIPGLNEILSALSFKSSENSIKKFNEFEELLSITREEIIDRGLKCLSQSKTFTKCKCQSSVLIIKNSRKAEILVHISSKNKKENGFEPPVKKQKIDNSKNDTDSHIISTYESDYTTEDLNAIFKKEDVVLMPEILREHLRFVWAKEADKMKLLLPFLEKGNFKYPTDMFFMENILINPPMNRVPAVMDGDKIYESPETANLSFIVNSCSALKCLMNNITPGTSDIQSYHNKREGIFELQRRVNICLDSAPYSMVKTAQPGLRQKIDKKAGLIRQNINAKRVNSACRSVISPDPNIGLDKIGVPVIFMKTLMFPEIMHNSNYEYLYQCIINGPDIYPGAISYKVDDKPLTNLKNNREQTANYLVSMMQQGKVKIVINRHANEDDILIMNRQPTLHKNSMQAHDITVILDPSAKTLRMSYSNCKAYNADFDGDEMNGHYMQSIMSQADAKIIANVANQHSTVKDGSPLAGLIQDHVIAGTRICMRNTFLERHEYFDLVKYGLKGNYIPPMKLLPPAIIRPSRLWTGKQVLSTIIMNSIPDGNMLPNIVLYESKKNVLWKTSKGEEKLELSDVDLVIIDGYICTGIFDKVHIGPSQRGLISDLRELYGNVSALNILTNLSRCLNRYLVYTGFTTNLRDGYLNEEGENVRSVIVKKIKNVGLSSIIRTFDMHIRKTNLDSVVKNMQKAQFDKSDDFKNKLPELDQNFKCLSNMYMNTLGALSRNSLKKDFPINNLLFMASTGAKGGDSNVKKIAIALGAIEIAGQRTPLTLSGRTLPSYDRYDVDPASRGFCMSRFTTGIKPQELFFESMAGRDGLVDTAVKTSSSGYLQRCLIKSLEDITIRSDGTVRDNMDNIIEFKYGYDGLDVIKSVPTSNIGNMEVICRNLAYFKKKFYAGFSKVCDNKLRKTDENNIEKLVSVMKKDHVYLSEDDQNMLKKIFSLKLIMAECDAGEAVGLLAAQSIGEPSTQMTLNTFHNIGQSEMNVTLGIPRLREILMTGSENIKTPSMSIPILATDSKSLDKVLKKFNKLRLKDVINLPLGFNLNNDTMEITFNLKDELHFQHLTHMSVQTVIERIENVFFKALGKSVTKHIDNSEIKIKEDKEFEINKEDNDDDKDEEEEVKMDFTTEAVGAEEEKISGEESDDDSLSDLEDKDDEENEVENEDEENDNNNNVNNGEDFAARKKAVLSYNKYFVNYEVSNSTPKALKLTIAFCKSKIDFNTLLLRFIQNTLLSETKGVDKAIVMKLKTGDVFCTEGYNFLEVCKYDKLFDLNKFHTNNIVKMAKMYGIESAISAIIFEIKNVFAPYSIEISSRHLRLIAEYMTFSGSLKAFNRSSMKYHSSQFQRASFETALEAMCDMLFKGNVDHLQSPSSNMLMGQIASHIGSNSIDIFNDKNCDR